MKNQVKRLSIVLILLLTMAIPGKAQFTITAYPPPNNFAFEDLWHFIVTGPQNNNFKEFYVTLRVFNDKGSLLLKSNTAQFNLPGGSLYVNKANLTPIQQMLTYFNDLMYQDVVNSGGFFPAGNYHMVFGLWGRPTDGDFSELQQSEYDMAVEVLFPPVLINPPDEAVIDNPFPLLTWLPAYQASTGQKIFYNLRLTEIYEGQTPYQSITANPSYLEQFDIPITMLPYPASANGILLKHHYAWQVAATIGGVPVAYSQIWSFTYDLPENTPEKDTSYIYGHLQPQLDAGFYIAKNQHLHFIYQTENYVPEIGDSLRFKIYATGTGEVIKKTGDNIYYGPYVLKYGENRYSFELGKCGLNLKEKEYYVLEVTDGKGRNKYLRFYNPEPTKGIECGAE